MVIIFQLMGEIMNTQKTTSEKQIAKAKEEIIKEAKRIEESALYTSKGHFAAAYFWSNFHLWIGIPIVVLASISGASIIAKIDSYGLVVGVLSIFIAALSSVMTFLNPNQKSSAHLNAGNNYDSLQNNVRIFWSIDCWREESDSLLTERLKYYSEQKDKLNQSNPQVPGWAYKKGKAGIKSGEADYEIDKK